MRKINSPFMVIYMYDTIKKRHRLVESCRIYWFVTTFQQVVTSLSVSSSYNKSVKIRVIATCHLQTCCNLLKQFAASLWITSFDNQLATRLLTTCSRLVVNKLSQAMRLVITRCCKDCKMSTDLLYLACFELCRS